MTINWGASPWTIDFRAKTRDLPDAADFVVVGGGFSGLSAAAWLARLAPGKSTLLLEAGKIGDGASGRTGGMVLAETAAGDLPGLGDVLAGFTAILKELEIDCDLSLTGTWEIGRRGGDANSPISWNDSGELRVVKEVPGGKIDPGKMASGLARAAEQAGAHIAEHACVEDVSTAEPLRVTAAGRTILAGQVLVATNAQALELGGLKGIAQPRLTMAVATEPLEGSQIESLGLGDGKPFYTMDFPYLWGRRMSTNGVVFGAGLVEVEDWRELRKIDVREGRAAERLAWLEKRVHELHPVLHNVQITHLWGGPILFTEGMRPVFRRHFQNERVLILGGYNGHGVALSVYLGKWAAEVMAERRELPKWEMRASA